MTQNVETLHCEIELPDDWEQWQRSTGQIADGRHDRRRYPRFACNSHAALRCTTTLPSIPRSGIWCRILLRNVSRCGAGFLHSEQLFPDEEALIVLPNGSQRVFQVMRCSRIGPKCFEVGEFADGSGDSILEPGA